MPEQNNDCEFESGTWHESGMRFPIKFLVANMVSLAAVIGATVMAFMLIGLMTTNCN